MIKTTLTTHPIGLRNSLNESAELLTLIFRCRLSSARTPTLGSYAEGYPSRPDLKPHGPRIIVPPTKQADFAARTRRPKRYELKGPKGTNTKAQKVL